MDVDRPCGESKPERQRSRTCASRNAFKDRWALIPDKGAGPVWVYLVAFALPILGLSIVALVWPAEADPAAVDFTTVPWVQGVPSISEYVRKSRFPAATAAYHALSPLAAIAFFVMSLRYPWLNFLTPDAMRRSLAKSKKKGGDSSFRYLYAVCFFLLATFAVWIQNGNQFEALPIHESRWALVAMGPLCGFYCASGYLGAAIVLMGRLWVQQVYRGGFHGVE